MAGAATDVTARPTQEIKVGTIQELGQKHRAIAGIAGEGRMNLHACQCAARRGNLNDVGKYRAALVTGRLSTWL